MKKPEARRKLRTLLQDMGLNADSHLERIETGASNFSSEAAWWSHNRLPIFKERVDFKEIPVPSLFHQMFERGLSEDDVGELEELYDTLQTRTEIALREFEKGILVAPSDVGVGISQMVPVVVSALRRQDGLLAIEQPELHVHPAIQVNVRGTTRLTSAAIGEVLNRVCDVIIWLMSANAICDS
ncbi:MAG: AAA family ATPase [Candidatus Sulfotelmatobacter sp.]